jgi:hypothetical protein
MSNTDFTTEAQRHGENPKEGRAKLHIVSSSKEQGTEVAEGTEKMRPVSQAHRARRGLEMTEREFHHRGTETPRKPERGMRQAGYRFVIQGAGHGGCGGHREDGNGMSAD